MNSFELLEKISDLCSENRIIPFLGAGCSAQMLSYTWNSLMSEIAAQYKIADLGNMKIAQRFIDYYGKKEFCKILESKLSVDDFDDDKGYIYLAIASMGIGTIYTTNQDNAMEKCCEKHGFEYKPIITLDDLVTVKIGEGLYIKYHGDYSVPDSVVFGEDDYLDRIDDKDNFIDTKLKADVLGRNLLFIGYSFRDINLKLFLRRLKNLFGKIPTSFMIAWEITDNLNKECEKYSIQIVDPKEIFPNESATTAYCKTLNKFNDLVYQKKTRLLIDDFFNHKRSRKVVSMHEIDSLNRLLGTVDCEHFVQKFRTIMDRTLIPDDFEMHVVRLFIRLAKFVDKESVSCLYGLMFNLELKNQFNTFIVMVYFYISCNSISQAGNDLGGYSSIGLSFYPQELIILAISVAFDVLTKQNIQISDYYRGAISIVTDRSINIELLPYEIKHYINRQFSIAWAQKYTTYENPIKRQLRLRENREECVDRVNLVCMMYDMVHDESRNPYYSLMYPSKE